MISRIWSLLRYTTARGKYYFAVVKCQRILWEVSLLFSPSSESLGTRNLSFHRDLRFMSGPGFDNFRNAIFPGFRGRFNRTTPFRLFTINRVFEIQTFLIEKLFYTALKKRTKSNIGKFFGRNFCLFQGRKILKITTFCPSNVYVYLSSKTYISFKK